MFPILPIILCDVWIHRPYVILTSKVLNNRNTITYLRISFPKSSRNSTFLWAKRTFCSGSVSLLRNWSIMEMILSSFRGFCCRPMSISWRYSRGLSCRHTICKYLNTWLVKKDTHTLCYTMKAMPHNRQRTELQTQVQLVHTTNSDSGITIPRNETVLTNWQYTRKISSFMIWKYWVQI